MYLADYHMHSRVSPDARYSMAEMAEAALRAGMDEVCFTDHIEPVAWNGRDPIEFYDWAALSREFAEAQSAVGGRIRLRLGIELGEAVLDLPRTAALLKDAPELDFIIGSTHILSERFDLVDMYFFHPRDEEEALLGIADYLRLVKRTAEWGGFDVLGHLTLPLRYLNENQGFHLSFDPFEAEVEDILRTVVQKGRGIELNTNRGNTPLPDEKWLRMYRDLGGEIITLGTDAHTPEFAGCAVRERQDLLRRCGFTRFCTFEKRRPVWHDL